MKLTYGCLLFALPAAVLLGACQPAAAPPPAPTAAPAAPPTAPAAAAASPAASSSPAAASPVAKPGASPAASPAAAPTDAFDVQAVANFYRGKAVRMRIGLAAGGGYDLYTRVIARHIGNHIPGNPTVIAENLPGGGGAVLAADSYNRGAKDGTEISIFPGGLFLQRVLGQSDLSFDVSGWEFVGAPGISEYVCETQDRSGIKDWNQLIGPNARQGAMGAIPGLGEAATAIVKDTTHANLKIVSGYAGTAPIRLAMEQGEVDGQCANDWSSLLASSLEDLTSGKQLIVLQLISQKKQGVPQGDAPTVYELLTNDEDRAVMKVGVEDPGIYARPYVVPPGVPPERLAALRQAFDETMRDPAFLADAQTANLDVGPKTGQELAGLITDMQTMSSTVKARLKQYYNIP